LQNSIGCGAIGSPGPDGGVGRMRQMDELLPFVGMCTVAVAVYSFACWLGYWF